MLGDLDEVAVVPDVGKNLGVRSLVLREIRIVPEPDWLGSEGSTA